MSALYYSQLKTALRVFEIRCGKIGQSPRVKVERRLTLRGKWECFQWKAHGQCSTGDSCSCQLWSSGLWKQVVLFHPTRCQNILTEKKATKRSVLTREVRFCVVQKGKYTVVYVWHLCVCQKYKSEQGLVYVDICHFRDVDADVKHTVEKRWCKRFSCYVERVYTFGLCISRLAFERDYSMWAWNVGFETHHQILQRHTWHQIKIREPVKQCGTWRKTLQVQQLGQNYVMCSVKVMSTLVTSRRPEEREFVVDSGSSMHMMSKKKNEAQKNQGQ